MTTSVIQDWIQPIFDIAVLAAAWIPSKQVRGAIMRTSAGLAEGELRVKTTDIGRMASASNVIFEALREAIKLVLTKGMDRARREHRAIRDACIDGDAEWAATLIRDHILNAGRSLIAFLEHQAQTGPETKS